MSRQSGATGALRRYTRGRLGQGILLVLVFYASLAVAVELTAAVEFRTEHLLVALVPVVVLLVFSDRVERIGAGSVTLTLRRQARSAIEPRAVESLPTETVGDVAAHGDIDMGKMDPADSIALSTMEAAEAAGPGGSLAIAFQLGTTYREPVLELYAEELLVPLDVEYVLFQRDGQHAGLAEAGAFRSLLADPTVDVSEAILEGTVLDERGVTTASVPADATTERAFRTMVDGETATVAVVDPAGRFLGVVTESALTRELLLGLLQSVE